MDDTDRQTVETSIHIEKDRRTVYDRWTRFEDFPTFMRGVEEVERLSDGRLRWKADIGFVEREWEAEIVEEDPERVIAWRADGDVRNDGRVAFEELAPNRTKVTVRMEYSPEGFADTAGAKLGTIDSRIEGDLERFKELVEEDQGPEGADDADR